MGGKVYEKSIICTALVLGLLGSASSVSAATYTENSSGQGFSESWELTESGHNWIMNYGYNTDWTNEDYTHTTHSDYDHTATVSNGNGAYSDGANNNEWAGIEVTHSGSYVEYSITY